MNLKIITSRNDKVYIRHNNLYKYLIFYIA